MHQQNSILAIEKALFTQQALPSLNSISETHMRLWNATTIAEKISLWVGPHHFSDIDRLGI